MKDVASVLAMDRTTLTAALKPLEKRGLVTIEADPEDKRSRRLGLTPDGHRLLARAFPLWQRTHDEIEASLAQREWINFVSNCGAFQRCVKPARPGTGPCSRMTSNVEPSGSR